MTPYFLLFVVVLLCVVGMLWWAWRIVKVFRNGRTTSALLQGTAWLAIVVSVLWFFELIPMSRTNRIEETAEWLTGRSLDLTKVFALDDPSVRGEGYWIDVYQYSDKDADYFASGTELLSYQPKDQQQDWRFSGWEHTPVPADRMPLLELATPYFNWPEPVGQENARVRHWGVEPGSYYAYSGGLGNLHFYMINPRLHQIAIINHNP